jgi:hypothetical protein
LILQGQKSPTNPGRFKRRIEVKVHQTRVSAGDRRDVACGIADPCSDTAGPDRSAGERVGDGRRENFLRGAQCGVHADDLHPGRIVQGSAQRIYQPPTRAAARATGPGLLTPDRVTGALTTQDREHRGLRLDVSTRREVAVTLVESFDRRAE